MHEGYASYMETTLQLATNQGVVLPPRGSSSKNVLANVRTTLTLHLPDDDVGAILGKKGQNLVEVQQVSNVALTLWFGLASLQVATCVTELLQVCDWYLSHGATAGLCAHNTIHRYGAPKNDAVFRLAEILHRTGGTNVVFAVSVHPQSSRVTIKISDRSKMDPATNEREVTIAGMYSAVKLAEAMIAEKLSVARSQARNREGLANEDV